MTNEEDMTTPRELSDSEKNLLSTLNVDEDKIHEIESKTRDQSASEMWKQEWTYRFTVSNFQAITKRKRNHDTYAQSIMHPKPFSSKYVAHGIMFVQYREL